LQQLIDNLLDAFDACDPARITVKAKLHVVTHLIDDIPRFGPAIRYSTEIFECFNAVFRMCSVLSNHQAPSRDIAIKFAEMDHVKHIISGGYWFDKHSQQWIQAGSSIRAYLIQHPVIQNHLGWVPRADGIPGNPSWLMRGYPLTFSSGEIAPLPPKRSPPQAWSKTLASQSTNRRSFPADWFEYCWRKSKSVASASGDECTEGSWVFFKDEHVSHFFVSISISTDGSCLFNAYFRVHFILGKSPSF
jgi:hypothetical protein